MLAIIGGSAAYTLLAEGQFAGEDLPPLTTPFGPAQPVRRIAGDGGEFLFLSRHGRKGYEIAAPFVNYRANIYALKELGADRIIAWSGPGAIDPSLRVGQFALPDDLLDETRREDTFYKGTGLGFIRQSPLFCPELRHALQQTLDGVGLECRGAATYVCTQGPRLETPAEIRKYAALGAHLVGMTLSPEVFLARELEICYAAICYITNYAEGVGPSSDDWSRVFQGLANDDDRRAVTASLARLPEIVADAARRVAGIERACPCARTMERYRREGRIGPDWHTWLGEP
jgi:5'-methylthioadenosine phosphorylase